MSPLDDFDRSLARWFDTETRPAAPADVLDRALRATRSRRPHPELFAVFGSRWVGDGDDPPTGLAKLGRTSVRASIALLLLVLVLVAGALLVGARWLAPAPETGRLGHLAYTLEDGLYVAEWDGRNPRRIVSPSQLPATVPDGCRGLFGGPTWSPDGRHLALRTEWSDRCEGVILITDAEGSSLVTIPGAGWSIAWSADSSRIVTWSRLGESIAIFGIDGERQALIPAPRGLLSSGDHDPSWTPDGAAVLVPDGVVIPLDGTAPYVDPALDYGARSRVSPDGMHIAIGEGRSIVVASIDGSSRRILASVATSGIGHVLWSPTGDRIAYQVFGGGSGIVDVATGAATSLDVPNGTDVVRFSPEGDRILLWSYHTVAGRSSLWSVQADGTGARELVSDIDGGDWQWLPPGS